MPSVPFDEYSLLRAWVATFRRRVVAELFTYDDATQVCLVTDHWVSEERLQEELAKPRMSIDPQDVLMDSVNLYGFLYLLLPKMLRLTEWPTVTNLNLQGPRLPVGGQRSYGERWDEREQQLPAPVFELVRELVLLCSLRYDLGADEQWETCWRTARHDSCASAIFEAEAQS